MDVTYKTETVYTVTLSHNELTAVVHGLHVLGDEMSRARKGSLRDAAWHLSDELSVNGVANNSVAWDRILNLSRLTGEEP